VNSEALGQDKMRLTAGQWCHSAERLLKHHLEPKKINKEIEFDG
jgi:hypothetical protein